MSSCYGPQKSVIIATKYRKYCSITCSSGKDYGRKKGEVNSTKAYIKMMRLATELWTGEWMKTNVHSHPTRPCPGTSYCVLLRVWCSLHAAAEWHQSPLGAYSVYPDGRPTDVRRSTKAWRSCRSPPRRTQVLELLRRPYPFLTTHEERVSNCVSVTTPWNFEAPKISR